MVSNRFFPFHFVLFILFLTERDHTYVIEIVLMVLGRIVTHENTDAYACGKIDPLNTQSCIQRISAESQAEAQVAPPPKL